MKKLLIVFAAVLSMNSFADMTFRCEEKRKTNVRYGVAYQDHLNIQCQSLYGSTKGKDYEVTIDSYGIGLKFGNKSKGLIMACPQSNPSNIEGNYYGLTVTSLTGVAGGSVTHVKNKYFKGCTMLGLKFLGLSGQAAIIDMEINAR